MKIAKAVPPKGGLLPPTYLIGQKYWLDEDSIVEDSDGNLYIDTYWDEEKQQKVGRILLNNFNIIYRPLVDYDEPVSLHHFINLHTGLLLRDIIEWCKNNAEDSLSINVLKIIHDEKLDVKKNTKNIVDIVYIA